MAERAAWWVDRVIPHVATRQWVLTVPWKRRWLLARDPEVACGVLGAALNLLERWYRKQAGRPDGKGGSITAIQRFGSALNLNLHFHVIVLDGVYVRGADGALSFKRVIPHTADVEHLVGEIADACEAWLDRHGFGANEEGDVDEDDSLALLQQASVGGYVAVGPRAGRRVRRVQKLGGREVALPPRTATCDGYNLNAGVSVKAEDREGLERLCRYVLRPPLAKGRLDRREDGTVVIGLKRVWSDGTNSIELSPCEMVEKLAAIVPPARANQVIYRGVLAANASWRKEVIPPPPPDRAVQAEARREQKLSRPVKINVESERIPWAELLKRVFGVDGHACPGCGGRLTLRCVVLGPATQPILSGLDRATGPP